MQAKKKKILTCLLLLCFKKLSRYYYTEGKKQKNVQNTIANSFLM